MAPIVGKEYITTTSNNGFNVKDKIIVLDTSDINAYVGVKCLKTNRELLVAWYRFTNGYFKLHHWKLKGVRKCK